MKDLNDSELLERLISTTKDTDYYNYQFGDIIAKEEWFPGHYNVYTIPQYYVWLTMTNKMTGVVRKGIIGTCPTFHSRSSYPYVQMEEVLPYFWLFYSIDRNETITAIENY